MLQIIPIYLNQGGSGNPNVLISFLIVIEAIIVLWGLCHLIHCFLIKEKIVNYFSFDETYTRSFCANLWVIFFCVTNFAAIIICGTLFVYSHFFSSI